MRKANIGQNIAKGAKAILATAMVATVANADPVTLSTQTSLDQKLLEMAKRNVDAKFNETGFLYGNFNSDNVLDPFDFLTFLWCGKNLEGQEYCVRKAVIVDGKAVPDPNSIDSIIVFRNGQPRLVDAEGKITDNVFTPKIEDMYVVQGNPNWVLNVPFTKESARKAGIENIISDLFKKEFPNLKDSRYMFGVEQIPVMGGARYFIHISKINTAESNPDFSKLVPLELKEITELQYNELKEKFEGKPLPKAPVPQVVVPNAPVSDTNLSDLEIRAFWGPGRQSITSVKKDLFGNNVINNVIEAFTEKEYEARLPVNLGPVALRAQSQGRDLQGEFSNLVQLESGGAVGVTWDGKVQVILSGIADYVDIKDKKSDGMLEMNPAMYGSRIGGELGFKVGKSRLELGYLEGKLTKTGKAVLFNVPSDMSMEELNSLKMYLSGVIDFDKVQLGLSGSVEDFNGIKGSRATNYVLNLDGTYEPVQGKFGNVGLAVRGTYEHVDNYGYAESENRVSGKVGMTFRHMHQSQKTTPKTGK